MQPVVFMTDNSYLGRVTALVLASVLVVSIVFAMDKARS